MSATTQSVADWTNCHFEVVDYDAAEGPDFACVTINVIEEVGGTFETLAFVPFDLEPYGAANRAWALAIAQEIVTAMNARAAEHRND
jgi:hypothetical protein